MRVIQRDGKLERRILIGFITDKNLLQSLSTKWDNNFFKTRWSNLVAGWCVDYFNKYGEAPNSKIEQIFDSWQETNKDKESISLIEKFLTSLSDEYDQYQEEQNTDYLIDLSQKFFNEARVLKLSNQLQGDVDQGNLDEALQRINKFNKLEVGVGADIDLLSDETTLRECFDDSLQTPLITFPGDLGNFLNVRDCLHRDCFVSFVGPKGRGKTWMLVAFAWQALIQRRRVVFFEIGDMSKRQIATRFAIRAARIPIKPGKVLYPISLTKIGTDEFDIKHKEKVFEHGLDFLQAKEAFQHVTRNKIRSKESYFKLFCYPNNSISVNGIKQQLQYLARKEWFADVCIASGSMVLTDKGLIPIEKVTKCHKLWDGVNWVSHEGLVYKGIQDVITYQGLTATPDHLVHTKQGWRTIESARRLRLDITKTGIGSTEIRTSGNNFSGGESKKVLSWFEEICVCKMCSMWKREMDTFMQSQKRHSQRMQELCSTKEISELALWEIAKCPEKMYRLYRYSMEKLWRKRNQIQFQRPVRGCYLDGPEFGHTRKGEGDRQNQQRWKLRTWESSLVNQETELFSHIQTWINSQNAQVSDSISRGRLFRSSVNQNVWEKNETRGDYKNVGESYQQIWRQAPTWDLLNSGPLHRFTVQGLLVHNCVIDYADLLSPIDGREITRDQINTTWKALRSLSQEFHCLVLTATQSKATSYTAKVITRSHFADDRRKIDHVNVMLGLNATEEMKRDGILGLNFVAARESEFSEFKMCYVAGCLPLANPLIKSCM